MEICVEAPEGFLLGTGMENPGGTVHPDLSITPSTTKPQTGAWLHSTCLLHLKALNRDNPTTLSSLWIQPNGKKIR